MSESAQSLSAPVSVNKPDGSSIRFPKLSPADWIRFRGEFRFHRKVLLMQSLAIAGATSVDTIRALNEFDSRRLSDDDVVEWINEPEGQREAVRMSLARHKGAKPAAVSDEDVDGLDLSPDQMLTVAAGVFDIPLVQKKGEKFSDAPFVTPPTGGETPASSEPASAPAQTTP